jgi:hypothetical protein
MQGNNMNSYEQLAEDFYVNMHLNTEMTLPTSRETVLGFFERLQKQYPSMRNFFVQDSGEFVLEEDKDLGQQRWVRIEPRRLCGGMLNPGSIDEAMAQHGLLLDLAPFMLSVSTLDCEALDLMFGFDFPYRGNHDALVAEALGLSPALDGFLRMPGAQVLSIEPSVTMSLDESCRMQARLMIETRTSPFHVRRGEYPDDPISVFFTVRNYGPPAPGVTLKTQLEILRDRADHLLHEFVVEQVLRPLQVATSTR